MRRYRLYKEKYPLKYHPDGLTGPFVVEEIYRQTKGDALIVTEVGQHQMWTAQYYKFTSRGPFSHPEDWARWDMVSALPWERRSAVRIKR